MVWTQFQYQFNRGLWRIDIPKSCTLHSCILICNLLIHSYISVPYIITVKYSFWNFYMPLCEFHEIFVSSWNILRIFMNLWNRVYSSITVASNRIDQSCTIHYTRLGDSARLKNLYTIITFRLFSWMGISRIEVYEYSSTIE